MDAYRYDSVVDGIDTLTGYSDFLVCDEGDAIVSDVFVPGVVNRIIVATKIAAACPKELANTKNVNVESFNSDFYDVQFVRVHATDIPSSDFLNLRKARTISFA